ncbi:response regulator receiver [Halothece sp. PCC 7418]|uniref:response regulator n=1 Tax=Halothece sp. (strain PCC 7418) TaxID=65093 RepID=UPI0002A0878C|nr:response regulator [Halothece sp. PCC 7418]AFZ42462.1 response regulator receiver [Halothece sp. PCC 7418]
MYGSLHELDLRSLLELLERSQATGQLLIQAASAFSPSDLGSLASEDHSFWLLSLSNGQITYAVDGNLRQYQRLQDYLRRYQVETVVERLPKTDRVALPRNFLQATARSLPEYNYLWVLLEHHVLTATQGKQILEHIVHETMFDLLSLQQGFFRFQSNTVVEPQLTTLEISPLLTQVMRELQQWKQLSPYVTSPEQCPLLTKNHELKQALTPSAYRSLAVACQGELSLRRIARYLNKDLLTISQALYPYIQRGWLQMLAEEEALPSQSIQEASATTKMVYIGQENEVRDQIEYILKSKGYLPMIIDDPIDALSMIARSQPSLVFCALELSTWSGEQLSYSLRNLPTLSQVPIILVTPENPDPIRLTRAQLLGVTEILVPPIQDSDLLHLLRTHLNPKDQQHQFL